MKLSHPLLALCTSLVFTLSLHADPLAVGAEAPKVVSVDQDGKPLYFNQFYMKGPTLVYFYPKADTPGCTKQACSIRDDWEKLKAKGIQVLGVSEDNSVDQKKFQDKYSLPFTLVADTDGKVAQAFGVPMRGKVATRQSFLIKDGKVVWNMLDKTTTSTHADDVMKAFESLGKS